MDFHTVFRAIYTKNVELCISTKYKYHIDKKAKLHVKGHFQIGVDTTTEICIMKSFYT